jgi:dihydrofolate reductase
MAYIATSLDGYIARTNGDISWLDEIPNPENSDFGYSEFISNIDAIIMGRHTFEKVLEFDHWPYEQLVFVLSNTLKKVPEYLIDRVEIISGDLETILEDLEKRELKNLYVDGGKTIQSFLKEDLIDEMIITTIPILLGDGIPLFGHLGRDLKFKCVKVELRGDLVKHYYQRIR